MAYTRAPMQDTDQTKSVNLFLNWNTRTAGSAKDIIPVNTVFEQVDTAEGKTVKIYKRDGLVAAYTIPSPAVGEKVVGVYDWTMRSAWVVVATNAKLYWFNYTNGALVGSTAYFPGDVGFTEFQYEDGTVVLILVNNTQIAMLSTAGVLTFCGDPDRPTSMNAAPVYLDGYLFVSDGNNIYNSDLNDPMSWSASGFISVDAYPDQVRHLERINNYIVAFGLTSIQYYYDVANTVGTPLAIVGGATKAVGYAGGAVRSGDRIYFVGKDNQTNPQPYVMEGLKIEPLTNASVSRWLSSVTINPGLGRPTLFGTMLALNGHNIYHLYSNTDQNHSYGYDTASQIWAQYSGLGDNCFRFVSSTFGTTPNLAGRTLVAHEDRTSVYAFSAAAYQDLGVNYTVSFQTDFADFGTRRMKFGGRLLLDCDMTPSTSLMYVSWTDDDYQTYSTPRAVDVSNKYTQLYATGAFRKRAHKVTYTDNFPMRWEAIEFDYSQGQA